MAKLLVNESAGSREFDLVDAEAHIGRELDNSLRLADPSISRHHAVVRRTPTGYEVQDLQSSNGVLLNGSRVQTAPLQDGDRITLGQIQITFLDPKADIDATVAVMKTDAPAAPLGTMRMSADQMALIHGAPPPEPEPVAPPAPPPPPPPAPMPPPVPMPSTPPPAPAPPAPKPPPPPPTAPAFGEFTSPGTSGASMSANPLPAFIQPYLPPVPDDAVPTGERGDFVTRLLAVLIDAVIPIAVQILCMILAFIPFLGCLLLPLMMVLNLAYFIFLYWCLIKFGATFGKKIMKLRVVPEDNPTGRIDVSMAVLRFVGHVVNCFIAGLPYLMIFGGERKGLQDIFSKSIVIKVDR